MMDFKEALDAIYSLKIKPLSTSKIFINECVGRTLASHIKARESNPKFDTSNMDGYAFCYEDLDLLKTKGLKIDSINKAGNKQNSKLKKGECIKTFTGAKIPQNADTIVIIEDIIEKNNHIFLNTNEAIKKYQHIRKCAQNYKQNDILLKKNHTISPLNIGILAENNNVFVDVYNKPKIAILSSGDELLEIGEIPHNDNFIYSSNHHTLKAIAQSFHCETKLYPLLKDSKKDINNAIHNALQDNDMLLITGGMSKGDFDFSKTLIKKLGRCVFEDVKIKPGKCVSYILCENNKHILGLPGNPSASVVAFMLFGRLILQKMLQKKPHIPFQKAILQTNLNRKNETRIEFLLSKLQSQNGIYTILPKTNRLSYMINDFEGAMAVLQCKNYQKGDLVDIILLNDLLSL